MYRPGQMIAAAGSKTFLTILFESVCRQGNGDTKSHSNATFVGFIIDSST